MPIVNFIIPDSSPVISYVGTWGDSDAATQSYTNGTFHFTQEVGAYATFGFNGTGVSLWGALRGNHDEYTVTVDGQNNTANGHTDNQAGEFNKTLFETTLSSGFHTVQLTNTPKDKGYVDLDWAVITVGDGNTKTISNDFWLDDTAGNFTYDAGWARGENSFSAQYLNSTFIATNKDGAKAKLSFYGNAVALYGSTSDNHGDYTVALDGGAPQKYTGKQKAFRPKNLLYYASGLPSGSHSLEIANGGTTWTDLDYAIVSVWDSDKPLSSAVTPGPSSSVSATSTVVSVSTSLTTTRLSTGTLPTGSRPPTTAPSGSVPVSTSLNPSASNSAALPGSFGISKSAVLALGSTLALGVFSFVSMF